MSASFFALFPDLELGLPTWIPVEISFACFRGYADCVEGAKERGIVYGMGTYEKGEVKGTAAMTEANEMGRRV